MGYSQENGYVALDIQTIMLQFMQRINVQFNTSYTYETFEGTNLFKYFYAIAQEAQGNEIKTSEIFQKLQLYFDVINDRISRPAVTNPGIVERLERAGYVASVKPMIDDDAGKIHICVDVDDEAEDYADTKAALGLLISQITIGGGVTQGTEVQPIVISNGQSFDFKYNLPTRLEPYLRLTINISENNQFFVEDSDFIKNRLIENIEAKYRLGRNFEPQKYFTTLDAPWSSEVILEYSLDYDPGDPGSATWSNAVYESEYDELFDIGLDRIIIEEG